MRIPRPAPVTSAVFEGSRDGVVATDAQGRIVAWNAAAERMLGFRADQVLGRPCWEVLAGVDRCGNRFCRKDCELMGMARRGETVRRFEMSVRSAAGEGRRASFSILTVPGAGADEFTIVHLFRVGAEAWLAGGGPAEGSGGSSLVPEGLELALTPREHEILRRLDEGANTADIAAALGIGVTTVRTHIQHILRKLEVHSRLEAVALTLRRHLV